MNSPSTWPDLTKRLESAGRSRRGRAADEGGIVALLTRVLRDFRGHRGSSRDRSGAPGSQTKDVA